MYSAAMSSKHQTSAIHSCHVLPGGVSINLNLIVMGRGSEELPLEQGMRAKMVAKDKSGELD